MTREVQILSWCDLCEAVGEHAPGVGHVVILDGAKPLEIDVCDVHGEPFDAVAKALAEYGRPTSAPGTATPPKRRAEARAALAVSTGIRHGRIPTGERPFLCPFCPLDYSHITALGKHAANVHGVGGKTFAVAMGGKCPTCGKREGVLAGHVSREHGLSIGAAWREALAAGDPFKVCAPIERKARNVARG